MREGRHSFETVGEWFAHRTFHHEDFSDVSRLVDLKLEKGHTVSVCLPTLNVADTLREILVVIREELVERHPLIDELAVIDSHSTDGTVEIAREEGASVFYDSDILPRLGTETGKGEALWKSLHQLRGDIIVWIDSDVANMHPRFVYGLVGPLLEYEPIGYVKAFYRRPLRIGEEVRPTGGGRVTELVARPIINLLYPRLVGLIQPLSGEYAGRRSVLESVPFYTGYGVEICLNVAICREFGLGAIAQVDLEVREHRNQSLEALSRMSFAVMQAAFRCLSGEGFLELSGELGTEYNSVVSDGGTYGIEPTVIGVVERPPMREVPEYRGRHHSDDSLE